MSAPAADDLLEIAREYVARGDAAAERGEAAAARWEYELAIDQFRSAGGEGERGLNADLSRAQAHEKLGQLAETGSEREDAREQYAAALKLLADLMPHDPATIKPRVAYLFMQVARLDGLADRPQAEHLFRTALILAADIPNGPVVRSTIWHYVGAYCERRRLPIAAFLAHQQSLEELPEEMESGQVPNKVRDQLFALQELQELLPSLAFVRLLELHGALADDTVTVSSAAEIVEQMGLEPAKASELLELLEKPGNIPALREQIVTRMQAAIPGFARRFVDDELDLEDTRSTVLPPVAASR